MEITIITAAYNCEKFIEETLNSVLAQTYTRWRLIAFDDGSTDNTAGIIKAFADKDNRITLLRRPGNKNGGLSDTLTKALSCVKTDYCAFLECDDIWAADYLEKKVKFIRKNPGAEIIFNDVKCFGFAPRAKKLTIFNKAVKFYIKLLNPFKQNCSLNFPLMSFNPIPTFSCIMAKTKLLEEYGFAAPFPPAADYWLWARASFKHQFYFIDEQLTHWRLTPNSYTMKTQKDLPGRKTLNKEINLLYKNNLSAGQYWFKYILSFILKIFFIVPEYIFKKIFYLCQSGKNNPEK